MKSRPLIVVLLAVALLVSGCATRKSQENVGVIDALAGSRLIATGKALYPGFTRIPVSQVGNTLEEVTAKLGKWDRIGDIGPGPDGNQGYPFSNRHGYDYVLCIGVDGKVSSAWRRRAAPFKPKEGTNKSTDASDDE